MIDEHFEALESAFLQSYGLDLREVVFGSDPYGARRLLSLVRGLPPGGPLHRAIDPAAWDWDWETELLATLVDALWFQSDLIWRANFKGKPPKVDLIKRPYDKPKQKKAKATTQQMQKFFGGAVVPDKE